MESWSARPPGHPLDPPSLLQQVAALHFRLQNFNSSDELAVELVRRLPAIIGAASALALMRGRNGWRSVVSREGQQVALATADDLAPPDTLERLQRSRVTPEIAAALGTPAAEVTLVPLVERETWCGVLALAFPQAATPDALAAAALAAAPLAAALGRDAAALTIRDAQQVLDQMGDAMVISDAEGCTVYVNPEVARLAGQPVVADLSPEEALARYPVRRPDGTLLTASDAATLRVMRDGEPVRNEELVITRPDGVELHTLWTTVARRDAAGRRVGAVSVGRDVSELRLVQRELEQKIRELEGLCQISQLGASAASTRAFYHLLGEQVARLLNADSCSILQFDEDERVFRPILTYGVPSPATAIGEPVQGEPNTIFSEVLRGRTVQVSAGAQDERIRQLAAYFGEMGLGVMLLTRLPASGQGTGLLAIGRLRPDTLFSDDEVRLAEIVAGQVAREVEALRLRRTLQLERDWRDAVLNQLPEGVYVFDAAGRVSYMNQIARQTSASMLDLGDHWTEISAKLQHFGLQGGLIAENFLSVQLALETGAETIRKTMTVSGGDRPDRHYEISCVPVRNPAGQISGAVLVFQNVTQSWDRQSQNEQLLEEIEESDGRFRAMVNMVNAAVMVTAGGKVYYTNALYREIFGLSHDIVGHSVKEAIAHVSRCLGHSEDYMSAIAQASAEQDASVDREVEMFWPQHRYLERSSSPIQGGNGAPFGRIIVYRDVTAQKEAVQNRDRFLGATAWALWAPLRLTHGGLTLLLRNLAAAETAAGEGENIEERLHQVIYRAETLSSDLLYLIEAAERLRELSRLQEGRLHISRDPVDLEAAAQAAVAELPAGVRRHVSVELSLAGRSIVMGDGPRLRKIIQWLAENAVTYSSALRQPVLVRLSRPLPGLVRLEVADRGIGLAPGEADQMFSSYFRSPRALPLQPRGLGVSLLLARAIVRQHGGALWAESLGPSRGATLILELPLSDETP